MDMEDSQCSESNSSFEQGKQMKNQMNQPGGSKNQMSSSPIDDNQIKKQDDNMKEEYHEVSLSSSKIQPEFSKNFMKFYEQVSKIKMDPIKFKYIQETFNIELEEFPQDHEIINYQQQQAMNFKPKKNSKDKKNWSEEEKKILVWVIGKLNALTSLDIKNISDDTWKFIASLMDRREQFQCKQKWLKMLNVPLLYAPWTQEEDELLKRIIMDFQKQNKGNKWSKIALQLNTTINSNQIRNGKQCRERWNNYLNPMINKKPWTEQEDLDFMQTVLQIGKKWAIIQKTLLNYRSENSIKNRFNCLLNREKKNSLEYIIVFYVQQKSTDLNVEKNENDDVDQGVEKLNNEEVQLVQNIVKKIQWRISQEQQMKKMDTDDIIEKFKEDKGYFESRFKVPSLSVIQEEADDKGSKKKKSKDHHMKAASCKDIRKNNQQYQLSKVFQNTKKEEVEEKSFTFRLGKIENIQQNEMNNVQCCLINIKKSQIYFLTWEYIQDFMSLKQQQIEQNATIQQAIYQLNDSPNISSLRLIGNTPQYHSSQYINNGSNQSSIKNITISRDYAIPKPSEVVKHQSSQNDMLSDNQILNQNTLAQNLYNQQIQNDLNWNSSASFVPFPMQQFQVPQQYYFSSIYYQSYPVVPFLNPPSTLNMTMQQFMYPPMIQNNIIQAQNNEVLKQANSQQQHQLSQRKLL